MAKSKRGPWSVYMHIVPKEISDYEYDKYYIGVTRFNPEHRWQNGNGYKRQYFYKAIKKYGWDNIIHKVVASGLSEYDAFDMERLLIFLYQSRLDQKGYNATDGGEAPNGYKCTEEERVKRSEAGKRAWSIPSVREKRVENYLKGKDHPGSKKIVLINTGQVFDSIKEAHKETNLYKNQIVKSCKEETICESKRDENGYNYCFAFYDDYICMTEEDIKERLERGKTTKISHCNESIVCLNTKEVFKDCYEAHEAYPNTSISGINMCCDSRYSTKSSGKSINGERLVWVYQSDYVKMSQENIQNYLIEHSSNKKNVIRIKPRQIIDTATQTIYDSAIECTKKLGIPKTSLYRILNGKSSSCSKYEPNRFVYYDDYIKEES